MTHAAASLRDAQERHAGSRTAVLVALSLLTLFSSSAGASPRAPFLDGTVRTFAATPSRLYVGGLFSQVGPSTGALVLGAGGERVSSFPVVDGLVLHAAADGTGGWFIGGRFTRVGTGRGRGSRTYTPPEPSIGAGGRGCAVR